MSKIIRNFIEVSGLSDEIPGNLTLFKYQNLRYLLTLAEDNPGIKDILRTNIEICITNTRVVKTSERLSLEGIKQTELKLAISGQIIQTIEYILDSKPGTIRIAFYKLPFNSFITLPGNFSVHKRINIRSYIEDIFIKPINNHNIVEHFYVLLTLDI